MLPGPFSDFSDGAWERGYAFALVKVGIQSPTVGPKLYESYWVWDKWGEAYMYTTADKGFDIIARLEACGSGVARTSPMLWHSCMGTLRLYELPREVQKLLGGSGGILPPNFTASQVGSEVVP